MTGADSGKEVDGRGRSERPAELDNSVEALKASGYGHTSALLVPERLIPPHNQRSDVFEVKIARRSEPEREYPLYATHKPGYDRAYLNLFQLDPRDGEEFLVKHPALYSRSDFVREYNRAKPPGLENTELAERGRGLCLKVGESELPFVESKLRVYQGRVVLDGKIEGTGEMKIAKSLDGFDFRLQDHSRIESIRDEGSAYKIEYRRTAHDQFPHVKLVPRAKSESRDVAEEHKIAIDPAGLKIDNPLDLSSNVVKIELSSQNQLAAWEYWRKATSKGERRVHIGDIGQSLAEAVLRKSEFGIIAKEPFGHPIFSGRHVSERKGPDLVCDKDEQAILVMVKHWREPYKGLADARKDIEVLAKNERRREDLEKKLGREITGGLAMEIHWSYKERKGIIYLDYIKFGRH